MMLANALRGAGVIIAVLGLLDPAVRLPWSEKPRVAIRQAEAEYPRDLTAGIDTPDARTPRSVSDAARLQRVRERFAREFTLVDAADHATRVDATVVIGAADARLPVDLDALSTNVVGTLVGVTPSAASARDAAAGATAATGTVRITDVIAPRAAHLSGRVRLTVALDARGLRGRTSVIEVQSEGLTLARTTHAWTEESGHARVALDVTPIREGLAQFNVIVRAATASAAGAADTASAVGAAGTAGAPALARADVGVHITNQPLRILFVEPRPSWTTRFIRLALAGDTRFRIDAQSQVSRGLAARTTDAPARLTAEALAPFDAVIVGAPDQLGAPDVEALRAFARLRGGLIVFAPDRLPQGAYVDLLPAEGFEERLLETPQLVSAAISDGRRNDNASGKGERESVRSGAPAAAGGRDAGAGTAIGSRSGSEIATASGGEGAAGALDAELAALPLLASELALPRTLRPGAIALAQVSLQEAAAARPLVVASPLGDGQVLFTGAMDAWRFRDRPQPRFDAFWRQLLVALGAQAPPPVTLTLDPSLAQPGEPVTLHARWRRDLVASQTQSDGTMTVRATLAPASAVSGLTPSDGRELARADGSDTVSPSPSAAQPGARSVPIRLWPADRPGEFRATLNAPAGAGVYAMSLNAESPAPPVRAPLLVSSDVRRPERSWEAFRARIEARGGLVVTDEHLDQAVDHLRRQTRGSSDREPVHPWRSAWWILPFAGCLGGEWLLRRRRGDA